MRKACFAGVIMALFLVSGFACPALAGGLTVYGGKIDDVVIPGQEYSYTIKVQNTSGSPMDIVVACKGYGTSPESAFVVLETNEDTGLHSAREMLTVSPSEFHLEPNDSQDVTVFARIPPTAGDGGRYAIVDIQAIPPSGEMVSTVTAVAARVLLTIESSNLDHSSEITAFETNPEKPWEAFITVAHTGNHHYRPHLHGKIIRDDNVVATAFTEDGWPMVPDYSRRFALTFTSGETLPAGDYTIVAEVCDEPGMVLAQHSQSLKLETAIDLPSSPAKAPPGFISEILPVRVTLNPSSAATLKTEDERVCITFPPYAVVAPAQVSLSGCTPEQLPALPQEYILAATCFKVEGLNGLLAKDAILIVNYSAADLEKAGGDASRLSLARWDEADGRWTKLKTAVDEAKMTLTTSTDRFSTWAVVVRPPVLTINWPLLYTIIGAVILASAGLYFIMIRKRR